jgi:hypothetical protein
MNDTNSDEDMFITQKFVMERTGRRDIRSLQKYERPDIKTKIEISKSLDCGVSRCCKEKDSSVSEDPMPMAEKRNSTKEEMRREILRRKRFNSIHQPHFSLERYKIPPLALRILPK